VLKENVKLKLMVFERKILRRIYGSTKVRDGTWRIKSNEELNRLIGNKNILNHIKAQKFAWFGHLHRMTDDRMVKKYMKEHQCQLRPLGRPKNRWEDDVMNDVINIRVTNWKGCIKN
jgi:hypothetical protein